MKTIELGNGVKLSEISLGAGALGSKNPDIEERCFKIMDLYFELGGRSFDTARMYSGGDCDVSLGKWLKSRKARAEAVIVTKGSFPDHGSMFVSRLSPDEIKGDLDLSLEAIGIDFSDLHILHRDDVKKPVEEIVDSLDDLVKSGRARAVGVSNWAATRIIQANQYAKSADKSPIVCAQMHYSLALTTSPTSGDITHVILNEPDLSWFAESQMALMAFGPQARGWFVKRAEGKEPMASPLRYYDLLPENHRRLQRLQKLSKETGYSLSAITTAYVRDSGLNSSPLCSYSSEEQLKDSFGALKFNLTNDQIRYLQTGE
ncbi:MAG: aldo/keto reductase [Oscillospiraceae bacterium]|nr:aldo/keto reductase [Oscillospiraceae bacterium]